VREHRALLAAPDRPSFGLSLLESDADVLLVEDALPRALSEADSLRLEVTTFAPRGRNGLVQIVAVLARGGAATVRPEWTGKMRLGRADYTQITEGGPIPHPPVAPRDGREPDALWIDDRALDGAVAIALPGPLDVEPGGTGVLALAVAIGSDRRTVLDEARGLRREAAALMEAEVRERRALWTGMDLAADDESGLRQRRGVAYALDCARSRVTNRADAVITDHEILPLVWTRDAYYVCRMLLTLARRHAPAIAAVERFIVWLFEVAERPDGAWPRSSLASGQAKDFAFQLDQQLYPLLLVSDHERLGHGSALRGRYDEECRRTIDALLGRRVSFGLVPTAETPADDPLRQPFHFSSHVLLWHVLRAFHRRESDAIRRATIEHFASDGRFAYAIGGPRGQDARHYHDANDLPTVFAPGWGFCGADDALWRATIAFAWSPANEGYFSGRFGGLGSLHTPRPWTLGDLQDIIVARVTGDPARALRARERLRRVETWDTLLAEAYDETTGVVAARHWFAWPAAVRALLEGDPMLTAP
jgi:hypothetical protein